MSCIIRGLSLTRPWPFAFVNGPEQFRKRVENRKWKPHAYIVGQYVALHAAKSWDEDAREMIADMMRLDVPGNADSPHSRIFAVARVSCYVTDEAQLPPAQQQWFFGPFGWVLTDFVELVEPVACTGARGLWGFDDKPEVLAALRDVYRRSVNPRTVAAS